MRDFSDDVCATLEALGIPTAHLVGWSMGAGVVMQYALDHPVLSLTLESPVSPYGFGGTRRDGTRLTDDDAGTGGGVANPDFVQRLIDHDTTDEAPTSPRSVFRSGYVAAGYTTEHEDVWVESMLSTSTATGNYPGDSVPSENWPGFAAGTIGVLNTHGAPVLQRVGHRRTSTRSRRSLWIHGTRRRDRLGHLVLRLQLPRAARHRPRVARRGRRARHRRWCRRRATCWTPTRPQAATVTEIALEGVGHTPHLERPAEFRHALLVGDRLRRALPATRSADRGDHHQVRGLTPARHGARCGAASIDSIA